MNVTIRKIAADLQLAVSTVSKALHDSHEISAETKKRVLEYARQLDFMPHPYAGSLKRRETTNIAVVLPEVADSFFSTAINGIEAVAREKGYHVVVYLTHEDIEREQSILRDLRNGRVDGVLISIVSSTQKNTHIADLCAKGLPLVFFDRVCDDTPAAKVVTDDFESGYKATEHLLQKGCRKVAFLSMSETLDITHKRLEGYEKALADHSIKPQQSLILHCGNNEVHATDTIRKLLSRKHRPDGIVGSVEKVATLAYAVCYELNLRIPQDVKIVGFSHMQIAGLLNPSLTTITQPAFEMGKAAATILFNTLEKKARDARGEHIVIPSVLIERGSTQ